VAEAKDAKGKGNYRLVAETSGVPYGTHTLLFASDEKNESDSKPRPHVSSSRL